ncbi:MAG: ATP-binding protein [Methanotrichaceae archaeon]|nr:ATP-binding protein [Methanotrichaceae archaeon]
MIPAEISRLEENQRQILDRLDWLKGVLQSHIDQTEDVADAPGSSMDRLGIVSQTFHLSSFEEAILLLSASVELDSSFIGLCAAAQNDPSRMYPTFSLALAALPGAHWSAIVPGSPLRRWRLIEIGPGTSLTRSPLRIDERILHYIAGLDQIDERLASNVSPIPSAQALSPSQFRISERVAEIWSNGGEISPVLLWGGERQDRISVANDACVIQGAPMYRIYSTAIPERTNEQEEFHRLWTREYALSGRTLLVDIVDDQRAEAAMRFADNASYPLFVSSQRRIPAGNCIALQVRRPTYSEQEALWKDLLEGDEETAEGLASRFDLGSGVIHSASAFAKAGERALFEACRAQGRPDLEALSQRIDPSATWDDLVLPPQQKEMLRLVAIHMRQRSLVYNRWGFASKGSRGLGISALFSGASGTGKTMAAEVLAGELDLDLFRIDLSAVVSKYIGETEKNLNRIFDAAEGGGAILLFDEADALFGKRSEVKDSHDRYANIEVSFLLQRMEAYRGLAILTTNMLSALDPAFQRRIRFIVQFPFPDASMRERIWRGIYPEKTPLGEIDYATLARLNLAGGHIRNIALNAAFLAAEEGVPVGMDQIMRSARMEYAKLERPLTEVGR